METEIKPKAKEKPAGRPKGAKTQERAGCVELPAACPRCMSTRREPFKDGLVKSQDYEGEINTADGPRPYNRVLWRRSKCLDCGLHLTVREYQFVPNYEPPATQHGYKLPPGDGIDPPGKHERGEGKHWK